ncbi:PKD domain-containing protein [Mucilaginibacter sp.]|uniref:gliding motility-associated C-terminal domain-containing protein n=1 Tax=Mucilaginibacter sp. TaxID=1882438 RepID=UPI003D14C3A0
MKILVRIVAVIIVVFCFVCQTKAQNTTNSGTEFWTAYMDHNNGASKDGTGADGGSLMSLYITSTVNTSGKVEIVDNSFPAISFNVAANQVTIVTIPPAAFLAYAGVANKGIHITSLKPIAIYAHIYAFSVSGATLLLPVSTLGKDYLSINYTQKSNAPANAPAYSSFIVVATEDNTTVQITPAANLGDGNTKGATFKISLSKGEIYQGLSSSDLTGTIITSINSATGGCTKIAVFSGSSRLNIGCNVNNVTSDNLFQQVYPTASWGKNYITVPLKNRGYDIFRIILSNPAATTDPNVMLNGAKLSINQFINGYYEFSSNSPNIISADQPIQVVQYAVTQGDGLNCGNIPGDVGDPEMIYLNPLEQTLDRVTLYSTGNYQISSSYINVVIKTNAVPTFMLDGAPYTNFTTLDSNPLYSYAQISVQSGPQDIQSLSGNSRGTHTLSAGDGFNAIAYGFGNHESYGYAAGTNLQNLNENITLASPVNDTITQNNGCTGTTYKLQLTLPYQTTKITWDFKNGTTYTDNAPQVVSTFTRGTQLLYRYQYFKPVTYIKPGDTTVVATVFDPVAGTCGNNEVIEFDFNISAPPVANFSFDSSCLGDSSIFIDKTSVNGSFIKSWLWDFGDNTTSIQQNPKHKYANPGTYKVKLTVANVNGCGTDTTQSIYISHKPVAAFTASTPDCTGQNVTLTDQSTSIDGKITQWIWNYGDGKIDTLTNSNPVNHKYLNTGTDTVTLKVTISGGCSSTTTQVLNVNPAPLVDFVLPDVCLSDTYAQFTDKSTIADHTEANFTYLWNFGDPNANASNPNTSTMQNPTHKYTQASNYQVTLTVKSKYGCTFSETQPFTVNGDIPKAAFLVENSANLCSMNDVIFDDQSTVNFGNITKIVWYYDYNNQPADTVVIKKGAIPADRKFHHNYGLFNSPLTKSYAVRMDVYSGLTCVNSTQQNITLKANPLVKLSAIGPLCQSDQAIQINVDKNGFTGTGVFSGTGVSASGLFDPIVSGPGTFTVNYVFTEQNGCDYLTTEQVVVNAAPVVSAGADIHMLEGGQTAINATATGDGLTYKWTPSTGIDHDDVLKPITSPSENITYTLLVTNASGCSASSSVNVTVLKYPVIPSAFTPNNDGINDTWNIKYLDTYPNNTVDIYNRYGEKVYSSIGYAIPWDGRYKGADLPTGTYYYIINPKSGRKALSGSVTIIR